MHQRAEQQAEVEALSEREKQKSFDLDEALTKLRRSQETLVRTEKLAAVGQLAASVGHELRNPLFAIRNANTFITKKVGGDGADPKVAQFLQLIERELGACTKIISDLLDFARERAPNARPCPLRALVDEAVGLVPPSNVKIVNAVSDELPVPCIDKDQFRQVLINLVQNAVEAMPEGSGEVTVAAEGGTDRPFRISIIDNGPGMPPDVVEKVFEPLFTTKTKGTGLGLAIVSNMIKGHGGAIRVESELGRGSRFEIELPNG
jgi:signal transduction histidine kinase